MSDGVFQVLDKGRFFRDYIQGSVTKAVPEGAWKHPGVTQRGRQEVNTMMQMGVICSVCRYNGLLKNYY